jgi:hypothetical protein
VAAPTTPVVAFTTFFYWPRHPEGTRRLRWRGWNPSQPSVGRAHWEDANAPPSFGCLLWVLALLAIPYLYLRRLIEELLRWIVAGLSSTSI